jgi:hypothetical protein
MSAQPQPPPGPAGQAHYDEGYGQHQQGNTDSYYQDDHGQPYYDNNDGYADQHHPQGQHPPAQGADGYYDESCVASKSISIRPHTNQLPGDITTPTPIILISMKADITRVKSMAASTKMSTIMTNITTRERLLLVSNHHQNVEGTRRKIPRLSATSP